MRLPRKIDVSKSFSNILYLPLILEIIKYPYIFNLFLEICFIPETTRYDSVPAALVSLLFDPSESKEINCCLCDVLRRLAPSCAVCAVRNYADGKRSEITALFDRNISFQSARNIPSLCCYLPPVPPVSAK